MAQSDSAFEKVDIILHKMVEGNKVDVEYVEYKGPKVVSAPFDSNHV